MKQMLTKLANNDKLSMGMIFSGIALSIVSNIIVFTGIYYTALGRGVCLMDEQAYQDSLNMYKEDSNG